MTHDELTAYLRRRLYKLTDSMATLVARRNSAENRAVADVTARAELAGINAAIGIVDGSLSELTLCMAYVGDNDGLRMAQREREAA